MHPKTFQSTAVRRVLTTTQKKSFQVKAKRNLFDHLLLLSQDNDISPYKLFQYPVAPIPWSMATSDGSMLKTNKVQLMHHLEAKGTPCSPPSVESCTYVVDGNAGIHSCVSLSATFQSWHYRFSIICQSQRKCISLQILITSKA